MTEIIPLHTPIWQYDGTEWHLIVGNRSVARLVTNETPVFPDIKWLSVIDDEYLDVDHGWHAVDFAELETAQFDIEQWWLHVCRGEMFAP